jgi:hypothetical protein
MRFAAPDDELRPKKTHIYIVSCKGGYCAATPIHLVETTPDEVQRVVLECLKEKLEGKKNTGTCDVSKSIY